MPAKGGRHMPMSPYLRNRLIIAAVIILGIVCSFLIPPAESFRDVSSGRAWVREFRTELFRVSASDEAGTARLSQTLCQNLQAAMTPGMSLKDGMAQIENMMAQIHAQPGKMPAYINQGHITYYFTPIDATQPLTTLHEKAKSVFIGQGIGPGYAWLNPVWYKNNRSSNVESKVARYVTAEPPYIVTKFETPFPLLEDFTQGEVLTMPPRHLSGAMQYAGLKFAKAERRDVFTYTYVIDMRRWYQKILNEGRYYNIDFQVSARRNKDGTLDDLRIATACKFPSKGVLYTSPGMPPAAEATPIAAPVVIPSCPDYLRWFRCKNKTGDESCPGITITPAACPAEAPNFPKADYAQAK